LVNERWTPFDEQCSSPVEPLEDVLLQTIRHGEEARIANRSYVHALGCDLPAPCRAGDLWAYLYQQAMPAAWKEDFGGPLRLILEQGTLSRRIAQAVSTDGNPAGIAKIYGALCDCLADGRCFDVQASPNSADRHARQQPRARAM
jgi:hypothetical protein